MKSHDFINEIEKDLEFDIYAQDADYFEDDDTMSASEAGFMVGYLNA
jgi:hypothetical protein